MAALVILQELLSYLGYSVLLVPVPFFALLHASLTGGTVRSLLQSLVASWRRENRARAEVSEQTPNQQNECFVVSLGVRFPTTTGI